MPPFKMYTSAILGSSLKWQNLPQDIVSVLQDYESEQQ